MLFYFCLPKFTSEVSLTNLYLRHYQRDFEMKFSSCAFALVLGALATVSSATQIQGIVSGYAPGSVDENMSAPSGSKSSALHSDFSWSLGAELLTSPVNYLMAGGGIGFFSVQKDGGDNVVMPAIPLWGSVGVIGPEQWIARPYFMARVGYAFPAAKFSTWWSKPLNFLVGANLGVQLPYHMGVEFNCTYLSMNKNFKDDDVNFRLNALKIGGSVTVRFDLFGESSSAASNTTSITKTVVVVETSTEPAAEDYSSYSSDNSGSTSNDDPYSAYGETSTETGSSDYGAGSSSEPAAEEVASEGSTDAAEETAAEEAVEEPAPEKAAPPAPEEKPAAKKSSKKTTKKAAKKTTKKKAAKKTTKKTTTKKKK